MDIKVALLIAAEIEFILILFLAFMALKYRYDLSQSKNDLDTVKTHVSNFKKAHHAQTELQIQQIQSIHDKNDNLTHFKKLYLEIDTLIQDFSISAKIQLSKVINTENLSISSNSKENIIQIKEHVETIKEPQKTQTSSDTSTAIKMAPNLKAKKEKLEKEQSLRDIIFQQRNLITIMKEKTSTTTDSPISIEDLEKIEHLINDADTEAQAFNINTESENYSKALTDGLQKRISNLLDTVENMKTNELVLKGKLSEFKHAYTNNDNDKKNIEEFEKQINSMKNTLSEKEATASEQKSQINHMESEHQELLENYNDILSKHNVTHLDEIDKSMISDEDFEELKKAQSLLEDKDFELRRLQSEFKQMEDFVGEMSASSDSLESMQEELDSLKITNTSLSEEIEKIKENQTAEENILLTELSELREECKKANIDLDKKSDTLDQLNATKHELERIKIELTMMEDQFAKASDQTMENSESALSPPH